MAFQQILFYIITLSVSITSCYYFNPACTPGQTKCLDCKTSLLCLTPWIFLATPCQENQECDSNSGCCVEKGFQCPLPDGVFPDVNNCTFYYCCTNWQAQHLECPYANVFNPTLGRCVPQLSYPSCTSVTCHQSTTVMVYPADPSFYYQCVSFRPQIQACPDNQFFDPTFNSCQNICKQVGLFPYWRNCTLYTSCEYVNQVLVGVRKSCSAGYSFNSITLQCEIGMRQTCRPEVYPTPISTNHLRPPYWNNYYPHGDVTPFLRLKTNFTQNIMASNLMAEPDLKQRDSEDSSEKKQPKKKDDDEDHI